jgi:tetratricopeptide (TPR) repeat protein
MNRLLTAVVLLIFFRTGFACINEYHTKLDGTANYSDGGVYPIVREKIDRAEARETADRLLEIYLLSVEKHTPLDNQMEIYSDYGVQLIYLGEYAKAKRVYLEIERRSPNRYQTASNLGTVYELLGQNDSALVWIRKAMALNPGSHEGSEWIHIKILKWKLRNETVPDVSLLGIGFGTLELPENTHKFNLDKLEKHLRRQLRERTKLVPPKDLVVGRLYFDLGNVVAQTTSANAALPYYRAARKYGYDTPLLQTRIAAMKDLIGSFSVDKWIHNNRDMLRDYYLVIIACGLAVWIGCLWLIRRAIRKMRLRKAKRTA